MRRLIAARLAVPVLWWALAPSTPAALAAQAEPGSSGAQVLLVTGLGGSPEYSARFRDQAVTLLDALEERWGLAADAVRWLAEDPDADPGRIAGTATLESIRLELDAMAGRTAPGDAVLVVLLGHGSGRGDVARLNLPGPDLSGEQLSEWLVPFAGRTVAVVNAASASGGFLPALSGAGRIVVTATRSARERELTHFGRFFVDAFAREGADVDKDERISLLEAFQYAKGEVERLYERDNQMLTEHALLDDDGDGEGTLEPTATGPDGSLASRFFVVEAPRAVAAAAADDPELARLLAEKRRLEDEIAALRARRGELGAERYETELEALLVELALTSRAIRERGGGP